MQATDMRVKKFIVLRPDRYSFLLAK